MNKEHFNVLLIKFSKPKQEGGHVSWKTFIIKLIFTKIIFTKGKQFHKLCKQTSVWKKRQIKTKNNHKYFFCFFQLTCLLQIV